MANTAQAKKRARQAEQHRQRNAGARSMVRTHIKNVVKAIEAGDAAVAQTVYQTAVPIIDRMTTKKIIPKNAAARYKSRLLKKIRKLAA